MNLDPHDLESPARAPGDPSATSPPPDAGPTEDIPAPRRITEGPGTRIGPYKLLQKIGEGGMGVVYMAEQEKPVRRRVALKIIKPGMDTDQVDRPVRGRAPGPGPDGPPEHRQGARRRRHRHRPAVLRHGAGQRHPDHRVLRPEPAHARASGWSCSSRSARRSSTPTRRGSSTATSSRRTCWSRCYDGKPVPKVIDFGVAKAIDQRLTERTMFTQFGADRRHARIHEPRAGRDERAGHRHAQRHLLAGRPALRAADRHDAAGAGQAARGGLRRDPPADPRGGAAQAEHAAERVEGRRWPSISAQRQTEPAQADASWCAASSTGS